MPRNSVTARVRGMGRDAARGVADPRLCFEGMNVRVMAGDKDNGALCVTNERGTEDLGVAVRGVPVGSFACDGYLGVFSYEAADDGEVSHITVYEYSGGALSEYWHWSSEGSGSDLGFREIEAGWRVESVVSVEAENSIRVYWADGVHEMRVVDFMRLRSEDGRRLIPPGYFSSLPPLPSMGPVTVSVAAGHNGHFRSGTVQLFMTAVINGNETNLLWQSPLYYCHRPDGRAFAPDATDGGNDFTLSVESETFNRDDEKSDPSHPMRLWRCVDYLVVYAVHRATDDGAAVAVRREVALTVNDYTMFHHYYVDRSYFRAEAAVIGSEEAADPDHIRMLNRRRPTGVRTLAQKDGLLFMGGFGYPAGQELDSVELGVEAAYKSDDREYYFGKRFSPDTFNGQSASHVAQLAMDSYTIGHFKRGESYALGVQLMDECGHWGAVVPVVDKGGSCLHSMTLPPKSGLEGPKSTIPAVALPFFRAAADAVGELLEANPWAVAVRPVVAYLDPTQARYKLQGFAAPTIFCEKERAEGLCHAKLSPFTRAMRYYEDGQYSPLREAVNPARVIIREERDGYRVASMATDVYLGSPSGDKLRSALGYQPTSCDQSGASAADSVRGGTYPASQHWAALGCVKDYNCELQTSWRYRDVVFKSALIPYSPDDAEVGGDAADDSYENVYGQAGDDICTHDNSCYYVDAATVTLHSPDIEDWTSLSEKCVVETAGSVGMTGFASDTSIVATGGHMNNADNYGGKPGFQHLAPSSKSGGARCAMNLPNWVAAFYADWGVDIAPYWAVPPFGVADFLNAEEGQYKSAERSTSKLTYRQLANYRYCGGASYYTDSGDISKYTCDARVCDGSEVSASVIGDDKRIYKPAEDVAVVPSLNSMWSNGPYYFGKISGEPLGIRSVGKFNAINMSWTWLLYATVWLRRKENSSPLDYSMVSLLSTGRYGDDGYWMHNGTVDDFMLTYGGLSIGGPRQERVSTIVTVNGVTGSKYVNTDDSQFNAMGSKAMRLGNTETQNVRYVQNDTAKTYSIELKYCSTPHAVLSMPGDAPLPNYGNLAKFAAGKCSEAGASLFVGKGWNGGDSLVKVGLDDTADLNVGAWASKALPGGEGDSSDGLWLLDVVNNEGEPSFTPSSAQWMVAGEPVYRENGGTLRWMQGDWYYQRWDCLRTYPKSVEDASQVVEIVSVMIETRRNIDARYDSHRGTAFLQASPSNFNLFNAGTQPNNFLTFTAKGEYDNVVDEFPCSVTWGLPKTLNSNIDAWTQSFGVSTVEFDGDKGGVTALVKHGNQVYCFQPSGVSVINYNNRTQVSAGDGLPVELAASGTVDGKVYISDHHGAATNAAVVSTETGVYFSDAHGRRLCRLSDKLVPLSDTLGFTGWVRSLPSMPSQVYADRRSGRVMFDAGEGRVLGFSEQGEVFESLYSLEGAAVPTVVRGDTIAAHEGADGAWSLWRLGTGPYNSFFGVDRPFWVDYLLCGGGAWDKVWDNAEFCGDVFEDGEFRPKRCPFNLIRAYTEYQDSGERALEFRRNLPSPSKNLFRAWRAFIPRDATASRPGKVAERIRNPWAHVVLKYDPSLDDEGRRNDMARVEELTAHYNESPADMRRGGQYDDTSERYGNS